MPDNITVLDFITSLILGPLWHYVNLRRTVRNYWSIALFKYGLVKETDFTTLNGKSYHIKNQTDYEAFFKNDQIYRNNNFKISDKNGYFSFSYLNKKMLFSYDKTDIKGDVIRQIRDIFYFGEYKFLHPKNKVVIDIGANMGDTALYFWANGAKKVYAVEAMPRLFRLLKKNIKLNKISNIIPLNMVASKATKSYNLPYSSSWAGDIKESQGGENSVSVGSISLLEIINNYSLKKEKLVLKVDIEGGEYNLILDENEEILKLFDEIAIEYHYGYLDLEAKLKKLGFNVKHTRPRRIWSAGVKKNPMYIGMLKAKKE